MNWLDIVLVVLGVTLLFVGARAGLLRTAFLLAGIIVGLILAANLSELIGDAVTDNPKYDGIATVIAYAVILILVIGIAQVFGEFFHKKAQEIFLGPLEALGGGVLDAGVGLVAGLGIVIVIARLGALIPDSVPGVASQIELREHLDEALVDSALIPYYLDARKALPAKSLGMVPGDFNSALDEVERRVEEKPANSQ